MLKEKVEGELKKFIISETMECLNFGFQHKSSATFGTGNVGCIYPINRHENIITTNKNIYKAEDTTIKNSLKCQYSTSLFIPEAELIVAVTAQKSLICVIQLNDMENFILKNFDTDQVGVFHIIYSKKSSALITFGSGIKVWNFDLKVPERLRSAILPTVKISLRHNFDNIPYESSIINPPSFDYNDEILFIPTQKGIIGFNLDGKMMMKMSLFPANSKTAHAYIERKKRMLVYDDENGLNYCQAKGFVHTRYSIGASTIIWLDFINVENAVLMNNKGSFYILNLKTGKSYNIYSTDKIPNKIFLLKENCQICLCYGPHVHTYNIIIPWKLWSINVTKSNCIRRIERRNEAARIISFTSNSFVKFFSPKDGSMLTAATPKSPSSPVAFLYNRGFLTYNLGPNKKIVETHSPSTDEKLYMVLSDGHIAIFDTTKNPCLELSNLDIKAKLFVSCFYDNEYSFAISSFFNEVLITDSNFQIKRKFKISIDNFCQLLFDPITSCLICVMTRETLLLDLTTNSICSKILIKGTSMVELNNDILYFGYEDGDIVFVTIDATKKELQIIENKSQQKAHTSSVTGFAFSSTFWISVSTDMSIRYWDYFNNNFYTIYFPTSLYGCEVLNGDRDVIVGTESDLMIIDGKIVFHGERDEVNKELDNFDLKEDPMKQSILENCRKKQKIEEENEEKRKRLLLDKEEGENRISLPQINKNPRKRKIFLSEAAIHVLNQMNNNSKTPNETNENVIADNSKKDKNQNLPKDMTPEEIEQHRQIALEGMMRFTDQVDPTPKTTFKRTMNFSSAQQNDKNAGNTTDNKNEKKSKENGTMTLRSSRSWTSDLKQIKAAGKPPNFDVNFIKEKLGINEPNISKSQKHAPRRRRRKVKSEQKEVLNDKLFNLATTITTATKTPTKIIINKNSKKDEKGSSDEKSQLSEVNGNDNNKNLNEYHHLSSAKHQKEVKINKTVKCINYRKRNLTPPQIRKRLQVFKSQKKRKNSTPPLKYARILIQMPTPLVVVDFDYVIQNYGRRKAKLGSKTIQNEKQNIVQQIAITSYKSVDNVLESVNNNNSAVQTNIPLNTSLSKTDINIQVDPYIPAPLIQTNKKHIFIPSTSIKRSTVKKLSSTKKVYDNFDNSLTIKSHGYKGSNLIDSKTKKK